MRNSEKTKVQLIAELIQMGADFDYYKAHHPDTSILKDLIAHSPVSVQVLDKQGNSISVNKAHTLFFGVKPPSDYNLFNDPILAKQNLNKYFEKLKQGNLVFFPDTWYNTSLLNPDLPNKLVWIKTLGFPLLNELGKPEGFVVMHENITKQKVLEKELKQSNEQLKNLTQYITELCEQDRKAFARDLHDTFGPTLNAIKMRISLIMQQNKDKSLKQPLQDIVNIIIDSRESMMTYLSELRAVILDDLGIKVAIENYARHFAKQNHIKTTINVNDDVNPGYDVSLMIYRVLQEALTNVAHHAEADTVKITLYQTPKSLIFTVTDNGIGIRDKDITSNKSYGIISMRERVAMQGGIMQLTRGKKKGSIVKITLPLYKD